MKYLMVLLVLMSFMGCGKGPQGIPGSPGKDGENGVSIVYATVPAGAQCSSGSGTVILFAQDNMGTGAYVAGDEILSKVLVCDGAAGQTGAVGATGSDATPVMVVQFCTGFTQSYPNTFAESGICVNNEMLGVYSENGGFLAVLPPGNYSSDGINSSCTFTIGANCTVSQ